MKPVLTKHRTVGAQWYLLAFLCSSLWDAQLPLKHSCKWGDQTVLETNQFAFFYSFIICALKGNIYTHTQQNNAQQSTWLMSNTTDLWWSKTHLNWNKERTWLHTLTWQGGKYPWAINVSLNESLVQSPKFIGSTGSLSHTDSCETVDIEGRFAGSRCTTKTAVAALTSRVKYHDTTRPYKPTPQRTINKV